jgi:predicted 3-demethylubiquinone-9 3-methyltransferase (glyoxalase superfamily)
MGQKITTFLTFAERAEEAVEFYLSVFPNSKLVSSSRYGEGAPLPKGTFMTATIELAGQTFMVLNGGAPVFTFGLGVSLFVSCETQEEVDRLWDKLSEGGQKSQCGWVQDKFGMWWQVIPSILGTLMSDPDKGKAGRVMKAMLQMTKMDIATLKRAHESA